MNPSIPAKIGKYEIVRKVGQGGFGVVYEGRDPIIRRRVAIKLLTAPDADTRKRFAREATIAGNLTHRSIVTVFDLNEYQGAPYIVQEFLVGEDLSEKIKRRQPLSDFTKLDYLVQIAEGLEYAHAQGVIHRDIKPHNIRILDDGQVKIMDFGIAKLASSETHLTQAGTTMGTAGYLPPEQIRGEKVDHRADIFSFGAMAYELLGGLRPFRGENLSAIFFAIIGKEPERLVTLWPACPEELERVIAKCLAKDPAHRYPSCTPLLAELRPLRERMRAQSALDTLVSDDTVSIPAPVHAPREDIETLKSIERRLRDLVEHGDLTAAELELTLARKKYGDTPAFGQVMSPLITRIAEIRRQFEAERQRAEKLAALLDRARTHRSSQQFDEALIAIKAALDLDPASQEAQSLLRSVEAAVERQRDERRRAEGARAAGVEIEDLIQQNQLDRADARLREALERWGALEPLPTLGRRIERTRHELRAAAVRDALARCDSLERDGRYEEAIQVMREALAQTPDDPALQRRLASVTAARQKQIDQQRRAEAAQGLRAEIERLLNAGDLRAAQTRLRQAERDFGTQPFRELRDRTYKLELDAKQRLASEHERQKAEARAAKQRQMEERERQKRAQREAKERERQSAATGPQPARRWRPLAIAAGSVAVLVTAIVAWQATHRDTTTTTHGDVLTTPTSTVTPVPKPTQAAATPTPAAPPASAVLTLDALPWAELVEVVDERGQRAPLRGPRYTPLLLTLPPGEYVLLLRNAQLGAEKTVRVKLGPGASERQLVELAQIDAADYLKRAGL